MHLAVWLTKAGSFCQRVGNNLAIFSPGICCFIMHVIANFLAGIAPELTHDGVQHIFFFSGDDIFTEVRAWKSPA